MIFLATGFFRATELYTKIHYYKENQLFTLLITKDNNRDCKSICFFHISKK